MRNSAALRVALFGLVLRRMATITFFIRILATSKVCFIYFVLSTRGAINPPLCTKQQRNNSAGRAQIAQLVSGHVGASAKAGDRDILEVCLLCFLLKQWKKLWVGRDLTNAT